MTYAQQVGLTAAGIVLILGLFVFAVWKFLDWQADRRRAGRAAVARAEIVQRARVTAAWNDIVANYDVIGDEYEPRLAEKAIDVPREGQGEQ